MFAINFKKIEGNHKNIGLILIRSARRQNNDIYSLSALRCYEWAIWHTTVHRWKKKKKETIKALDAILLIFQSYIYESELSED